MSPEQTETKDVDHRSDIYSLGVILYEMVTGKLPFEGETVLSVAMKHKSETPQDPMKYSPQIPEQLSQVILKCLEKDPENRYQSAQEVYDELAEIEQGFPTTERVLPRKTPITSKEITVSFSLKKLLIPALAVVAFIIIGVAIWQIFLKKEAIQFTSEKPSLAVMYFKNNTGDTGLDHWRSALSDLLITDLSQSQYIKVLSGERLFNILNQLDQLEATTYSSDVLIEVATKGNVDKILVGNYTRAGNRFRINITLQDAQTGELISSDSVEGVGESSFYAMVDELTRKIKTNFEFTEQELATDIDEEVVTITTSSPEAYKYYSEGRKLHLKGDYYRSIGRMQKALKIDPEFAMAQRSVAVSYSNLGMKPASEKALDKAFKLRHRVSERERHIIEGDYYRMSWRTSAQAMEAYQKLLTLYPEDSIGNTNLGILYMDMENWDEAVRHFKQNIASSPENALGFWNLSEVYAAMGLYGEAIELIEDHIKENPDRSGFHLKMALFLLYQGEYDRALSEVEKALSFPSLELGTEEQAAVFRGHAYFLMGDIDRAKEEYHKLKGRRAHSLSRSSLALVSLLQGKFKEAEEELLKKPVLTEPLIFLYIKSGQPEKALNELDDVWNNAVNSDDRFLQIRVLHAKGVALVQMRKLDEALRTASELNELLQDWINKKDIRFYHNLMGMIALEEGDIPKAVNSLKRAYELLYSPNEAEPEYHSFFLYYLAQAYLKAGDLAEAENACLEILSLALGRVQSGDFYAKSFYVLGKIYEQKGLRNKAIKHYETFLDLWKDADPGLPEVEEARQNLANLK
jgi:tetratricopeptide (TPR) repeat protein